MGGGYGQPPPGGGYGMQQQAFTPDPMAAVVPAPVGPPMAAAMAAPPPQPLFAPQAQPPAMPSSSVQPPDPSLGGGASAVVQVRCPACGMNTMATPGQPSVCFSCGQPLPAEMTKGGGGVAAPGFPLTGAMSAQPLVAPPNPYGAPPSSGSPSAATLRGASGQFTVRPGSEVRVGRDPALCTVFLSEPRISGVHATLRFDGGHLQVRDETSNNGTYVAGARIAPGAWTPVPAGAPLRFGPIEFAVQLET
jgi:hypothetical protein